MEGASRPSPRRDATLRPTLSGALPERPPLRQPRPRRPHRPQRPRTSQSRRPLLPDRGRSRALCVPTTATSLPAARPARAPSQLLRAAPPPPPSVTRSEARLRKRAACPIDRRTKKSRAPPGRRMRSAARLKAWPRRPVAHSRGWRRNPATRSSCSLCSGRTRNVWSFCKRGSVLAPSALWRRPGCGSSRAPWLGGSRSRLSDRRKRVARPSLAFWPSRRRNAVAASQRESGPNRCTDLTFIVMWASRHRVFLYTPLAAPHFHDSFCSFAARCRCRSPPVSRRALLHASFAV